ncbi:MAG: Patatin-like phospholipase [Planctomycetaceae bacterium]|nr:Patatin-like phospholipase [Planctomycetaceae bacterium]
MAAKEIVPTARIKGITLSGGGFRATLFHLGVVLYLVKTGRFAFIEKIFAVSGGSILAAHILQNSKRYANGQKDAEPLAALLRPIVFQNCRDRVFLATALYWLPTAFCLSISAWLLLRNDVAWGLPARALASTLIALVASYQVYRFWQHPVSIKMLERLFRKTFGFSKRWDEIDTELEIHFLATDLLTGFLGDFSKHGFVLHRPDGATEADKLAGHRAATATLSHAVAASASFPPAFPPYRLQYDHLICFLTDGGVFDNLGVVAAGITQNEEKYYCSDAGGEFVSTIDGIVFNSMVVRNVRSTDIVMNRLAECDARSCNDSLIPISIRNVGSSTQEIRRCVSDIPRTRTDLNKFSKDEAIGLIIHGCDVARKAMNGRENISQLLRGYIASGLDIPEGVELKIPAGSFSRSHVLPVRRLFVKLCLVFLVPFLIVFYSFAELPELMVRFASRYLPAPAFSPLTTAERELARELFEKNDLDVAAANTESEIIANLNQVAYYRSLSLYGPIHHRILVLESISWNLTINSGGNFLAVLETQESDNTFLVPLQIRLAHDAIKISVPPFRGRGRLLIICPLADTTVRGWWD